MQVHDRHSTSASWNISSVHGFSDFSFCLSFFQHADSTRSDHAGSLILTSRFIVQLFLENVPVPHCDLPLIPTFLLPFTI